MTQITRGAGPLVADTETRHPYQAATSTVAHTTQASYGGSLFPQHARLLADSAISVEVAKARGYVSVDTKSRLDSIGIAKAGRNVPGLLIPIHGVDGTVRTYQYRPDTPRLSQDGKPIKYETPVRSRLCIDVPPPIRHQLGDPSVPLWITEGARKADAAVSAGLACIALLGVWGWRGKNGRGGKAALPCWDSIALNGRDVYIAFDSDVMTKKAVQHALDRLAAFLRSRDARVHLVYLPGGEGGAKVGLDDFFAAGGTVEQLYQFTRSASKRHQPAQRPATATEASEVSDVSDSVLVDQAARDVLRGRFRWCPGLGWLQWDGRRWAPVDEAVVAEVIRTYLAERFTQKVTEAGPKLTHQRLRELRHMLTATKVRNVTTLARGMDGIYTTAAELDSDPDLLNTPSGVVDLRTGQLLPHDPDLLITKITSGRYRPGYTHPDWEKALEALPPAERDWYQVRVGQAITGHPTPDGVLVLLQGGGENGKSLLTTDGVVPALGDYADVASHKLLSATDEHSEEMASLRGQRFLISEEMTEGRALNITTIKRIMDVGEIRARHVYKSNMTFRATHSLFATTNYLPVVNETDHGTWRRLALLRFPFTFRKPGEECRRPDEKPGDPQLKSRIRAGRGGQHDAIVTWAVEGARRWYANPDTSLALTERIAADTRAWRVEADRILGYWDECLIPDPDACIITKELLEDFNEWLMANGHQPWSKELFHPRFKGHSETNRHGVVERRTMNPRGLSRRSTKRLEPPPARPTVYVGVRFRTETDDELEQASDQHQHASDRPARPHPNFSKPRVGTEKVSEGSGRSGRDQTTSICAGCGTPIDPVLAEAGASTHPTCDPRAA